MTEQRAGRAIVTGATSGIGAAVVKLLAREGWHIAAMGRSERRGSQLSGEFGDAAGSATFIRCDVSNRQDVTNGFAQAVGRLGGLDALVHAAGVEQACPAAEIDDALWDQMFDTNARGTMLTNQAAFAHLREGGGRIVNFVSSAGIVGLEGSAAYAASKGAAVAWTRTVAREWAKHRITVNCVAPAIWTPMYDKHRSQLSGEALELHRARMRQAIPLGGQHGDADLDLAPAIAFLLGDGARFITGQTIAIDGGMVMVR